MNFKNICFILLLFYSNSYSAENGPQVFDNLSIENATPGHVLSRVKYFSSLLEQIQLEIGKNSLTSHFFKVRDASPREVYFQALVMFRKINRLSFEWTGTKKEEPLREAISNVWPLSLIHI